MYSETEDVIRALAENAESVCRAITFPPDGGKGPTGSWAICRTTPAGRSSCG
jgi:hypothetical protein